MERMLSKGSPVVLAPHKTGVTVHRHATIPSHEVTPVVLQVQRQGHMLKISFWCSWEYPFLKFLHCVPMSVKSVLH